jgi:hypothetical protein
VYDLVFVPVLELLVSLSIVSEFRAYFMLATKGGNSLWVKTPCILKTASSTSVVLSPSLSRRQQVGCSRRVIDSACILSFYGLVSFGIHTVVLK